MTKVTWAQTRCQVRFRGQNLAYKAKGTGLCVSGDTVVCADNESLVLVHGQDLLDVALMQLQVFDLPLKLLVSDRPINCLNCTLVLGLLLELVNQAGQRLCPIRRCAQLHGEDGDWHLADRQNAKTKSISLEFVGLRLVAKVESSALATKGNSYV